MHVIHVRNVSQALQEGLRHIHKVGQPEPSRDGPVLVAPTPVTTVYERPTERVVFEEWRDANPFFHLFESIWMLAGQNDATWLDTWVRDFSSRYAEADGTMHGTYGHRWRNHWDQDQLFDVTSRLRRNHRDRRVVIQMWDPNYDLIGPEDWSEDGVPIWGEGPEPKDLPCNTHVYLRIRSETHDEPRMHGGEVYDQAVRESVLDLTVLCRSNDIVWGAYGANAVHFSVLHEYLAAKIGVGVGKMYQVSNNWHLYSERFAKMAPDWHEDNSPRNPYLAAYEGIRIRPMPMVTVPDQFLADCGHFVLADDWDMRIYANTWFRDVAVVMRKVHMTWRHGDMLGARNMTDDIAAGDWRLAVQQWLARRA